MMTYRASCSAVWAMVTLAISAGAQRGPVPVRGVVFDSLRGRPLRGAFVTIGGKTQPITTDARGRFRFDSVSPGVYTVSAHHAMFDSIGLTGLAARTTVADGSGEVRLAVPSFETLWRNTCRTRAPRDSGIVFGTIRDVVRGTPVANATVELSWIELVLDKKRRLIQRRWRVETRSNESGGYAICGVAPDLGLQILASADSVASGLIDLTPLVARVQRRDLSMGPTANADSAHRGTIVGLLIDTNGNPVDGARILMQGSAEVRSGADGRFSLTNVPAGTRQIEVLSIGSATSRATADVTPRDTAMLEVRVSKVVALAGVRSTANRTGRVLAAEFNERRKAGFGYLRDSTELVKFDPFINALREVPSLDVRYRGSNLTVTAPDGKGGACLVDVLIDGARAGFGHLIDLASKEVGGVEVYPRAAHVPARFVPPGMQPQCGMILVWTKYGLRNR
jgi:hypothetical protein